MVTEEKTVGAEMPYSFKVSQPLLLPTAMPTSYISHSFNLQLLFSVSLPADLIQDIDLFAESEPEVGQKSSNFRIYTLPPDAVFSLKKKKSGDSFPNRPLHSMNIR